MGQRVMLIPGFTSLELVAPPLTAGNPDIVVWFNATVLGQAGPGILQLDPSGIAPGPLVPVWARGMTPRYLSRFAPYGDLLQWLSAHQFQNFYWSYDWRRTAQVLATQFAVFMAANYDDQPFTVIGHSFGGLIARLAYPVYQATSTKKNWISTIFVAVPHWGSYEAARALAGRQDYYSLLYTLFVLGRTLQKAFPILPIISGYPSGSVADQMQAAVASWPGLYDLLPNPNGGSPTPDPAIPQLFKQATYAGYNPHVTQQALDDAASTQAALARALAGPRPVEKNVIASGYDTVTKINNLSALTDNASYDYTSQGDGVITVGRQMYATPTAASIQAAHYLAADYSSFLSLLPDLLDVNAAVVNPVPQPAPNAPVNVPPIKNIFPPPNLPLQGGQQVIFDP